MEGTAAKNSNEEHRLAGRKLESAQASCWGTRINGPCDRRHHGISSSSAISTRSRFLASLTGTAVTLATTTTTASTSLIPSSYSYAFEGGIGGLGKTKPQTGVVFWDGEFTPLLQQNEQGVVTAELNVAGQPVLVTFQTPWPLLASSSGLEARDLQNSESAFVSVIENYSNSNAETKQGMRQLLLDSVLSPQGKFGAYGDPMDVKVKQLMTTTTSSSSSNGGRVPSHLHHPHPRSARIGTPGARQGHSSSASVKNNNNNKTGFCSWWEPRDSGLPHSKTSCKRSWTVSRRWRRPLPVGVGNTVEI